jgi:SAM-dependent methyltransferase
MMASPTSQARLILSPRFSVEASSPPANLQPAQLPFIAEVKARLRSGEYRLESSPCPCGEQDGAVISEVERYGLPLTSVVCAACGTVRFDPYLDGPSLEDFYKRFYQNMYGRATDLESYFLRQRSYGEKILAAVEDWLKPGSWVFEVGCGSGGALEVFQARGYRVAGCDYGGELIESGRRRGVENIHHGSLADLRAALGDVKADLIYLHHVFEHVIDPLAFLEESRDLLKPGGRVIIVVPDVSRIASFSYPAGDLLQFLHVSHKYNYSPDGMRALGERAGYAVTGMRPDPNIRTPCSHMPELWVSMSVSAAATSDAAAARERDGGSKMLKYLRRTERLRSLGLCEAQLSSKTAGVRNYLSTNLARLGRLTPAKVVRRLKRS